MRMQYALVDMWRRPAFDRASRNMADEVFRLQPVESLEARRQEVGAGGIAEGVDGPCPAALASAGGKHPGSADLGAIGRRAGCEPALANKFRCHLDKRLGSTDTALKRVAGRNAHGCSVAVLVHG